MTLHTAKQVETEVDFVWRKRYKHGAFELTLLLITDGSIDFQIPPDENGALQDSLWRMKAGYFSVDNFLCFALGKVMGWWCSGLRQWSHPYKSATGTCPACQSMDQHLESSSRPEVFDLSLPVNWNQLVAQCLKTTGQSYLWLSKLSLWGTWFTVMCKGNKKKT